MKLKVDYNLMIRKISEREYQNLSEGDIIELLIDNYKSCDNSTIRELYLDLFQFENKSNALPLIKEEE
jgi:hypothetical protein